MVHFHWALKSSWWNDLSIKSRSCCVPEVFYLPFHVHIKCVSLQLLISLSYFYYIVFTISRSAWPNYNEVCVYVHVFILYVCFGWQYDVRHKKLLHRFKPFVLLVLNYKFCFLFALKLASPPFDYNIVNWKHWLVVVFCCYTHLLRHEI